MNTLANYDLVHTPSVPPIHAYMRRISRNVGEPNCLRHVECFQVVGNHPIHDPDYWLAAIASERTHLTGFIMQDSTVIISQECQDFAQLRDVAGLAPDMSERYCTRFELVTVDGADGRPQRLLRLGIGEDRRTLEQSGHNLIAALKSIPALDQTLAVEATWIRQPGDEEIMPFGLRVAEDVYQGTLGDPALDMRLLALEQS